MSICMFESVVASDGSTSTSRQSNRWMKSWLLLFAGTVLLPLLVACAPDKSTCRLFDPNDRLPCDATLVGLLVFGPVFQAIDGAFFEESRLAEREQALAEEKARRLPIYESLRDRVHAGDRSALRSCVAQCDDIGRMLAPQEEILALRVEAATTLIRVGGATPDTDDVTSLVIAAALLAEQNLDLDPNIIRMGFALSQRPDFSTLAELNPYTRNELVFVRALSIIYGRHLAIRVMSEPKMRASFNVDCVGTVVANYRISDEPHAVTANAGSACGAAQQVLNPRERSPKEE